MSGNRRKEADVFETVAEVQASTHLRPGSVITVHDDQDYDVRSTTAGADITTANGFGCFVRTTSVTVPVTSVQGRTGDVVVTTTDLSLENVDNTSDANKPVSTAQQSALDAKQDKAVYDPQNIQADSFERVNHTGTQAISTVSGLQTALDGKQETLVSGTNIKTINGQSVLGSGDLTVGSAGKDLTVKTTDNTGELPNWAAWIVDTSAARTRAMPSTPTDGEEVTAFDNTGSATANNVTLTVVGPTTIVNGVLDADGQSRKWRYDATGDVWDLVFSQAPSSGGGGGAPTITPFRLSFSSSDLQRDLSFPAGADLSNLVPVLHNPIGGSATSGSSDWVRVIIGGQSVNLSGRYIRFNRANTAYPQPGSLSGYWLEFPPGVVNVQYGEARVNLQTGDQTVNIANVSDPSKAFIVDLGGDFTSASQRVYSLGNVTNNTFTVIKDNTNTSAQYTDFVYAVVEFL